MSKNGKIEQKLSSRAAKNENFKNRRMQFVGDIDGMPHTNF